MDELKNKRTEIDKLDEQLVALFHQRMEIVLQILNIKQKKGMKVFDPLREQEIKKKIQSFGWATDEFCRALLDISKGLQYRHTVKDHLVLIGFMGTGKTTVGKSLATLIDGQQKDIDQMIEEQEKRTIAELFQDQGEAFFRQLEEEQICRIYRDIQTEKQSETIEKPGRTSSEDRKAELKIISCGGGAVLCENNRTMLKKIGKVILLTSSPEVIYERLVDSSDRPLLKDKMNIEYIESFMKKRQKIYYQIQPDIIVDTSGKLPEETAREILNRLY